MFNINFFKLLRVGGWINTLNIKVFIKLSKIFKNPSILEIGTHYGRSLIPIILSNKSIKDISVVDAFSNQKFNSSNSGFGNKKIFLKNIKKFKIDKSNIDIIDDTSLNFKNYYKKKFSKKKFDIIHIDGGHSEKEVINDIKIALKLRKKNSIVIIDDVFNAAFPEVLKAYLIFKNNFFPICLTDQKIFLSRDKKIALKIRKTLLSNSFNKKKIKFFNKETFYISENDEKLRDYLLQKFRLIRSIFYTRYHF
jgi:hypothetical protein